MKKIQLSDHFTIPRLLLFSLPSIGMQIVDSTYQVADGYFISNYVNETAFGAENLIYPPLLIVMSIGLMFGSGASALLSSEIGKGRPERANRLLTATIAGLSVLSLVLSAGLYFLMPWVTHLVGAKENMVDYCIQYGRVLAVFMPFGMLSMAFHPLLITAERPGMGLVVSIANAAANILLDWLFLSGFGWGIRGAAFATGLAWTVSAVIPLVFFLKHRGKLHFARPLMDQKAMGQIAYNGASEMVDAIAYAIVAVVFNLQLLRYLGEAGVEAYAVGEYVGGFFNAAFYGISMSIIPVAGFHLGQGNAKELHNLWRKGILLMVSLGIAITGLCLLFSGNIARFFVGYNQSLTNLSVHALKRVCLHLLLLGVTVFAGSYFTGLNQGTASLLIALTKGIVGPLILVWILPLLIGTDGLWWSVPGAELLGVLVSFACITWWRRSGEKKHLGEKPDTENPPEPLTQ